MVTKKLSRGRTPVARATARRTRGTGSGDQHVIETTELRKVFGPIVAVDRLSMKVEKGEVLGFLGPNGAGKSTTMKMVTGFLTPSRGGRRSAGTTSRATPSPPSGRSGTCPRARPPTRHDARGLPEVRRAGPGAARADAKQRIAEGRRAGAPRGRDAAADRDALQGLQAARGLAQAILHDPEVLILDEPTDGLDPNQKHEVRELIRRMAGEKCVVLSTHILEEVDAVCTRAVVIAQGRLVADETPERCGPRPRTTTR
jgi:ABC-2 type transport system ATP-binding protein